MRFVRYAMLLLVIALVVPGAAGALASGGPAGALGVRAAAGPAGSTGVRAPAGVFNVSDIEFSLQRGSNGRPVNPGTRFEFGPHSVWAFWSWGDSKSGSKVNYVLRFGESDVIWGTLNADGKEGRMEVELHRLDGLPLDLGIYRLHLEATGGDGGNVLEATFEIYDPHAGEHDNSNGNNNHNNNHNDNHNNNHNGNRNDNHHGDNENDND